MGAEVPQIVQNNESFLGLSHNKSSISIEDNNTGQKPIKLAKTENIEDHVASNLSNEEEIDYDGLHEASNSENLESMKRKYGY